MRKSYHRSPNAVATLERMGFQSATNEHFLGAVYGREATRSTGDMSKASSGPFHLCIGKHHGLLWKDYTLQKTNKHRQNIGDK